MIYRALKKYETHLSTLLLKSNRFFSSTVINFLILLEIYFLSVNEGNNKRTLIFSIRVIYLSLIGRNNCMLRVITYTRQTFIKT